MELEALLRTIIKVYTLHNFTEDLQKWRVKRAFTEITTQLCLIQCGENADNSRIKEALSSPVTAMLCMLLTHDACVLFSV